MSFYNFIKALDFGLAVCEKDGILNSSESSKDVYNVKKELCRLWILTNHHDLYKHKSNIYIDENCFKEQSTRIAGA